MPNEFLANPITLTAVDISVWLKALLEKAFLFTVKGCVLLGTSTTLEAYPAFNCAATIGATYNPFELESIITTSAASFKATSLMVVAVHFASKLILVVLCYFDYFLCAVRG